MPVQTLTFGTLLVGLLTASIRLATPLLLTALGETFSERSGILNIGIDGIMIIGGLAGFIGGHFSGSPWIGALCALVAGALFSMIHAYLSAYLSVDQVVSGLASNLLAIGFAVLVYQGVFGIPIESPSSPVFEQLEIPLLAKIPFIGEILFTQQPWVYISWILVPVCYLILFRTAWGLKVTAVGENPQTAEAAGINVRKIRFIAVVIGGALAGLGGMTLALSSLGLFKVDMVSGRGFLAVAIVTIGRWNPWGVLLGALLFGIADATQFRIQAFGIAAFLPPEIFLALPYLLAILVVFVNVGRSVVPRALCVRYKGTEERN